MTAGTIMFYDQCVMEKEELLPAWRAAHQEGIDEEDNLLSICSSINNWVKSEESNPRRRLSLRSAAVVVAGGAKLCLKRGQTLLEETRKLDSELTSRRKRPRYDDLNRRTGSENSDKSSNKTPEKMMGSPISYGPTQITYRKRHNSFEMSPLIPDSPNVSELNSGSFDTSFHQPAIENDQVQLVTYSSSCLTSRTSSRNAEERQSADSFTILELAVLRRSSGRSSKKSAPRCSESKTSNAAEGQMLSKTWSIHGLSPDPDDSADNGQSLSRERVSGRASLCSKNAEVQYDTKE